jgi:hypothetical protein
VEGGPALGTHPPAGEAAKQLLAAHFEEDHPVDGLPPALQHGVERLRLGGRPRETVQHEAGGAVRTGETLLHEPDHHVVGHEPAGVHVALGFEPERRLRRHRLAQHVASGHLGHAPLRGEGARLSALARPRRAEEDDARAHARARWRFRRKPS